MPKVHPSEYFIPATQAIGSRHVCCRCSALATWYYMPADETRDCAFCEHHVPRGCSCTSSSLDDDGREMPCIEYCYQEEGFRLPRSKSPTLATKMPALAPTATPMRGLLLSAHRTLRKAVDKRSAESKTLSTAAMFNMREDGAADATRSKLLQNLHAMREVRQAMVEFGGPELIPQVSGFSDYLLERQRLAHMSFDHLVKLDDAPTGLGQTGSAEAQWRVDARKEFAVMFESAFAGVLER